MVERTPALKRRFGIEITAKAISRIQDGSKFETIIGDPGDGQSPSCSIHDEYHEHADDGQVDTMVTGMGARDQPLQLLITTAGDNLAGPCYALIQEERKKLAGIGHNGGPPLEDETLFVEYSIDEGDDWKSEVALRKANPNADVSVSMDFLRARQRDAIATPRKAGVFKTKHLNLWVSAKAAYFDVEAWRKCKDPELPQRARDLLQLEWLKGRRAIIGLDMASKVDIAAVEVLILPHAERASKEDPYIRFGFYFLPAETVAEVPHYQGWDSQNLLDVTIGNIVDYDEIEDLLKELRKILQIEAVPYDPFQATQLSTRLAKEGFPVVEYRPTVLNFSEPMKQLDAAMRARLIIHGGDPVMEWEISNVVGTLDKKDNVYPNKPEGQAHLKIDNPVALMSAIGVHMGEEKEEVPASPWDDPNYSMAGA